MDSASENTCGQNHREELELASAHWQPVKDSSSLVVKIAHGCGGAGRARVEEAKTSLSVGLGPLVLHGQASGAPPQLFLPCHRVLEGEAAKHRWS